MNPSIHRRFLSRPLPCLPLGKFLPTGVPGLWFMDEQIVGSHSFREPSWIGDEKVI